MSFFSTLKKTFFGSIEMPEYTVTSNPESKEYEERHYPASVWVSTKTLAKTHKDGTSKGFWKCFKYIQGANEKKMKIDMTAPVAIKMLPVEKTEDNENSYVVSFFVGVEHKGNPPIPTNPEVYIEQWPAFDGYVRMFSGFANGDSWMSNAADLAKSLPDGAVYRKDSQINLGYDSPFKLFNRRNEVVLVKDSGETKPEMVEKSQEDQREISQEDTVTT